MILWKFLALPEVSDLISNDIILLTTYIYPALLIYLLKFSSEILLICCETIGNNLSFAVYIYIEQMIGYLR